MAQDWVSTTCINDITVESAELDQTARMCGLILIHTLRKTYIYLQTAGQALMHNKNIDL